MAEEAERATKAVEVGRRDAGSSVEAVVEVFHEVERSMQIETEDERVAQRSPPYAQRAAQPTPLLSIPGFDAMAPVAVLWECQVPWQRKRYLSAEAVSAL